MTTPHQSFIEETGIVDYFNDVLDDITKSGGFKDTERHHWNSELTKKLKASHKRLIGKLKGEIEKEKVIEAIFPQQSQEKLQMKMWLNKKLDRLLHLLHEIEGI